MPSTGTSGSVGALAEQSPGRPDLFPRVPFSPESRRIRMSPFPLGTIRLRPSKSRHAIVVPRRGLNGYDIFDFLLMSTCRSALTIET